MKKTSVTGPCWTSNNSTRSADLPADFGHRSVLYQSVLEHLLVKPGATYLDGTVGAGGHSFAIMHSSSPDGCLLGLDRDPAALALARGRLASFGERALLVHSSFASMGEHAVRLGFGGRRRPLG